MNHWIKKARKKLIEKFGGKCSFCGAKIDLQFAHRTDTDLTGKGRGRKERYYDVVKNPDAYILLCENCHLIYDGKQARTT